MAIRYTQAREQMIREQLVKRGMTDPLILAAMGQVPRHLFVEESLRDRAYEDSPLPIGEDQTISQPYMIALMAETLKLAEGEKVLEVGTGSGYLSAVLAEQGVQVCSVELSERLAERARVTLQALGYDNVTVHVGDGTLGWPRKRLLTPLWWGLLLPAFPDRCSTNFGLADASSSPWGKRNCKPWYGSGRNPRGCVKNISASADS